jgi:hypothetical protein
MGLSGSGEGPVECSCELSNETLCPTKDGISELAE